MVNIVQSVLLNSCSSLSPVKNTVIKITINIKATPKKTYISPFFLVDFRSPDFAAQNNPVFAGAYFRFFHGYKSEGGLRYHLIFFLPKNRRFLEKIFDKTASLLQSVDLRKRGQKTATGRSADCKAVRLLCVFSIVKIRGFASLFSYIFSKIKANTPCFVAFVYDRKYTSFYLLSIFNFCFSLFENAQKLCNLHSVLVLQTFIYVI